MHFMPKFAMSKLLRLIRFRFRNIQYIIIRLRACWKPNIYVFSSWQYYLRKLFVRSILVVMLFNIELLYSKLKQSWSTKHIWVLYVKCETFFKIGYYDKRKGGKKKKKTRTYFSPWTDRYCRLQVG